MLPFPLRRLCTLGIEFHIGRASSAALVPEVIGRVAADLLQSSECRLFHDHLLVKEPGTCQVTPWHQDQPYYNVEGTQNTSMWFPVDPVDRESTLEFVAGSHTGEWYMPRTFQDAQAKWFPEGTLSDLPDIEGEPDRWPVVGWALEPGDAVFFNMLTLHAAGGSTRRRRLRSPSPSPSPSSRWRAPLPGAAAGC